MEYFNDLLKEKRKSTLALILGLLSFAFAILWISLKLTEKDALSAFDWLYSTFIFLYGVWLTVSGLGYSIERLFGKAYIQIDDAAIKIKMGVFDKEQYIEWSAVSSVNYKPNNFTVTRNDATACKIKMAKLDYSTIQEIKNIIYKIANDKKISVNID